MARSSSSLGVAQYYGPRDSNEGLPGAVSTYGHTRELVLPFDYLQANAGIPVADGDDDKGVLVIPPHSLIKAAYLNVVTAFTSGGSATLELGLEDADGTTNDPDGLDSLAVAALTANSWHVLNGALVGATTGADETHIRIDDATAVFTAGKAFLIVEYMHQVVPN